MDDNQKELNIAWSSETGHSVDMARQLFQLCKTQGLKVAKAQPLNQHVTFTRGIWIMFVSTTGQGAPPHPMRHLWKNMMKKQYKIEDGVQFAIYSLGDRSYGENFGMTARKLRQRLKMLGGKELIQIGLGDDQEAQGYREVFSNGWGQQLFTLLKESAQKGDSPDFLINLRAYDSERQIEVKKVQQLCSRKARKVLWVELQLKALEATQGDTVEIYPYNRKEDVDYMLNHFGKKGDEKVTYLNRDLTLSEVLYEYVNISSTLNHYFFANPNNHQLIGTCSNPLHRQKMQEFASDYDEFHNFIGKYKRNIVQFLKDFDVKISLDYFLKYIAENVGRKYSIARVDKEKKRIWLLVKLVEINITEGRYFRGLCSHDIMEVGTRRKAKIVKGDITPEQMRENNILITLGTGIAPFIWVLDRLKDMKKGQNLLIYTNSYKDEIYHQQLCQDIKMTQIVSCTREEGGIKIQTLINDNLPQIKTILANKGRVFFCGPKQMHIYLVQVISKAMEITPEQLNKSKVIVYQNW